MGPSCSCQAQQQRTLEDRAESVNRAGILWRGSKTPAAGTILWRERQNQNTRYLKVSGASKKTVLGAKGEQLSHRVERRPVWSSEEFKTGSEEGAKPQGGGSQETQ